MAPTPPQKAKEDGYIGNCRYCLDASTNGIICIFLRVVPMMIFITSYDSARDSLCSYNTITSKYL